MLTLTSANFMSEVLQSKKVVIIDFWAPWCIDPATTEIFVTPLNSKRAAEVSSFDTLLTYDNKQIISDTVVKSYSSTLMGHCKELCTESQRKIRVTDEHPFFTPEGWKPAEELSAGDLVAVAPFYPLSSQADRTHQLLLSEKQIFVVALPRMLVQQHIAELSEKGLLPLYLDNEKLLILARILGCIFSDGNLYLQDSNNYREISFSLGTKEDVTVITEDLCTLGFDVFHVKKKTNKIFINRRSYLLRTYNVKVCSTSLWLLLRALGAPLGSKVNQGYTLPSWILEAPLSIKREFLAAYFGGDGPKIAMNLNSRGKRGSYNSLCINDIEFHKHPDFLQEGLAFAHQIASLLSDFGVSVRRIFSETDTYVKKDGSCSKIIHVSVSNTYDNAFIFYSKIGYRYAFTKDSESRYTIEFVRRILAKRQAWHTKYNQVMTLHKEKGYGYRRLSRLLELHPFTVYSWIKRGVRPTVNYHHERYPAWFKKSTKGLSAGLVWEPLFSIQEIYLESVQKISMANHHNFIANGFLSHNCGPCRIVAPTFEALSTEMSDVVFAKLNVDEQGDLAQRYNVQSIPTFLIFKNGKEVGRVVGAVDKARLQQAILSA